MSSLPSVPGITNAPQPDRSFSTYGSLGEGKLLRLCSGLGLPAPLTEKAIEVFRLLGSSWWDWPLGRAPLWKSDITDDGTPFEFSVAFDGKAPILRMLFEAQQRPMTVQSSWKAGLRLNERLAPLPGVSLGRFKEICDLFAPDDHGSARCALWHAVALSPDDGSALYKVYLNPAVRGPQYATRVIFEALTRLGMANACDFMQSNPDRQPVYFSLDLSDESDARVKIYFAHAGITADQIDPALAGTRHYRLGDGAHWIRKLTGSGGPFDRRPLLTCLSFTASSEAPTGTLHVPVRDYTSHDAQSLARACEFLNPRDGHALARALSMFARRPLELGRGLLTYVSVRRPACGIHLTTYLAPEAFAITPPAAL
jgi:DMATS type aromatic prenyltransferase